MKLFFKVLFCSCAAILSVSCNKTAQYAAIQGIGQGGIYTVKYDDSKAEVGQQTIAEGISNIYKEIDKSISSYDSTSILSRHNRGNSFVPDRTFRENKSFSESMLERTANVLNYKSARLCFLWRKAIVDHKLPTEQEIIMAKGDTSQYSFFSIGQGYTADRIGEYLESKGITNYLVSNGGELFASGVNQNGLGWGIAIEAPIPGTEPGTKFIGIFRVPANKKCGISTSGHYRHFGKIADTYYTHIVDIKSGKPVVNNLLSATIVAKTSMEADALSTYCLLLGKDAALLMIENTPDVEGCVVDSNGNVFCSSGFNLE